MSSSLSYCIYIRCTRSQLYTNIIIYCNNTYTHGIIIPRNSRANPLCYRFLIVLVLNENIYCVSRTNRHGGVFTSSTVPIPIELYRIGSKHIIVFWPSATPRESPQRQNFIETINLFSIPKPLH